MSLDWQIRWAFAIAYGMCRLMGFAMRQNSYQEERP